MVFPGGAVVKTPSASAGDTGNIGFDPWVRMISWRRAWQPTPVFLPGKSHGQRSLVGYSLWGCKESDMTKATSHVYMSIPISQFIPPFLLSWYPYICSLCLCFYSCFAKIICTVFLDSTYVLIYNIFFWLIWLCMTISRSILIFANDTISFFFYGWVILYVCTTFFYPVTFFLFKKVCLIWEHRVSCSTL